MVIAGGNNIYLVFEFIILLLIQITHLFPIEITVDAGVQRGKGDREGQDPQHGYGTVIF